jgi:hypothetical protein
VTTSEQISIAQANEYVRLSNLVLERAVVRERQGGRTWQSIGTELGVTDQGARSRWAKAIASANATVAQSPNGSVLPSDHVGGVDPDGAPGGTSGGE